MQCQIQSLEKFMTCGPHMHCAFGNSVAGLGTPEENGESKIVANGSNVQRHQSQTLH